MRSAIGVVFVLLVLSSSAALAGALLLYEVGTPDMGLASAGWAARAEDAATILTNPAGMTRLKENDLLFGFQALYADLGLAYEFAWGGTLSVDQERGPLAGRLAGAYEDSAMHFLGASLRWRL